jgi:adhesin isopeptide-forming family sspB-C2 type protein/LPXTG-motif cell wall-anchored protein
MQKKWKQKMLTIGMLTVLSSNAVVPLLPFSNVLVQEAYALTLPSGVTEIGKINNAPVLKAPTNDMDDAWFKELTQNLFEDIGTPSHIIKQVTWGSETFLYNGKDLSTFGSAPTTVFGGDGYLPTDKGINLKVGQSAYIQNVGTAIQTSNGEEIPLSMEVKLESVQGFGSQTSPLTPFDDALLVAKSQNGVLTLGWGTLSEGGTEGGGQGEGGGVPGGGSSDGSSLMFLDNVNYKVMLINSKTGEPLPQDTLMPIKMSDIDASQLATMGGEGALGYILSPDTKLSISGNGMVSAPGGAINNDTTQLSPNSYLVLKQWNNNTVGYKYTDGLNNHLDIVTGIFGVIPSWEVGGYLEIDKSTKQFGKDNWNEFYSFDVLEFEILNKQGKVVDTVKLDKNGKGKSKYLPIGEYKLREKSSKWSSSGQTVRPETTVKVEAGKTVTVKLENIAVTGQITVKKKGVESGTDMWNERYNLKGNEFELKSLTDGKTYKVTTDETGTAIKKDLPLGEYTITEVSASDGFANTFKSQKVKLTYKDQNTEVVFGEASGTNQEIKGQNLIQKEDAETGVEQNGKAVLKTAKYQLFYDDESTGSSKHKIGDPVKWTDTPKPELLAGEKVTQAVIGGKTVDFGDQVVIDVEDEKLTASVGNLSMGKYYWLEVDAGEGYVTDAEKHTFEITKKDDQTLVIVTTDTNSKEKIIDAAIKINKMVTLPESQGGSGFNDIEFTASPLEGTVADPVVMITGVDPVTGDDGYALGNLVYGDWIIEETKGVEWAKDIKPIYIHMETDTETDILTISASYYADFSKPFSLRKFALQDSSKEQNPNSQGTVGNVTSEKPTISLSTLHFNDNPEEEVPPTPPTPPTKDVTKTDGGESINEGNVALASDFVYVLNSSLLQPNRQDTTNWTINDDYDENYDRFNGSFKLYATTDFDVYKTGDELPNEFVTAEDKDGKVLFTAQQPFLDLVNKNKDKVVGFSIHADFYRYKDSDSVVNTFVETINDLKQDSNEVNTKTPKPQPHKFDLSKEKFDLTGEKLLDDDSEMSDRYADSNKDPYADKTDNNEKENINTTNVKPGQALVYQLWLDTTPFDDTSELTYLRMVDKYDANSLTLDTKKVKVWNAKGEDMTSAFKVEDKEGVLTVEANVFKKAKNSKGEEVSIIDTEKIPLNQVYKIEAPMTVKENVKSGTDIINTASQAWSDSDGIEGTHETEKRVNKVETEPKETPKKEEPKAAAKETTSTPTEISKEGKSLPQTGEEIMRSFSILGLILTVGSVLVYYLHRKQKKYLKDSDEQ